MRAGKRVNSDSTLPARAHARAHVECVRSVRMRRCGDVASSPAASNGSTFARVWPCRRSPQTELRAPACHTVRRRRMRHITRAPPVRHAGPPPGRIQSTIERDIQAVARVAAVPAILDVVVRTTTAPSPSHLHSAPATASPCACRCTDPAARTAVRAKLRHPHAGPIAQRLEQRTHNPLVQGSNPCGPTIQSR